MDNEAQQWGKLIKYIRQQKKLKQDDVAIGICTPSYLSRIENGVVLAEQSLYEQLFDRLGIQLTDAVASETQALAQFEAIYDKLLSNEDLTKQELSTLEHYDEAFQLFEHQLIAKLIYCRYLLSIKEDTLARTLLHDMAPIISFKQDRITTLYIAITAFAHLSFQEYQLLAQHEQRDFHLQLMQHANPFELANYHYHLAFANHRSYQLQKALFHIEQAATYAHYLYKPLFSLKLFSMKGVIFNDLNRFEDALREYKAGLNLLDHVSSIQSPFQYSSLHNNIAYCYECQKDFTLACEHYERAQHYEEDLHSLINWMRACYQKQDLQKLKQLFTQYGKENFSVLHHQYQRALLVYAYEEQHSIQQLKELETVAFSHFEQQQYFSLILFYAPLWATFYEKLHAYKQASQCYQSALHASEKMRARMSN